MGACPAWCSGLNGGPTKICPPGQRQEGSHATTSQGVPRASGSHQKRHRAWNNPLSASEGTSHTQPHSGFLASKHERINVCCFKPPNVWQFVTAALGSQFTWEPTKGQGLARVAGLAKSSTLGGQVADAPWRGGMSHSHPDCLSLKHRC